MGENAAAVGVRPTPEEGGTRPVRPCAGGVVGQDSGPVDGLVDSGGYAASVAAGSIMISNSTGVSFPKVRWRRLR